MMTFKLTAAPQNMYEYEGQDYSKLSEEDRKTFDQLLAGTNDLLSLWGFKKFFTGLCLI